MKRWQRVLAICTPALVLTVAGVMLLLVTLTSTCVYPSCPITNGTSACSSCATEYSENLAGWHIVLAAGFYIVAVSAAWFIRVGYR